MSAFWSKVNKTEACWLWLAGRDAYGYGALRRDGKTVKAHRVAYELVNGVKLTSEQKVLHSCDNPLCVNPSHLSIGTQSDNMADKVSKRRHAFGEKGGHAKLTERDVLEIRELARNGVMSQRAMAAVYGVDHGQISHIVNRQNWSHI